MANERNRGRYCAFCGRSEKDIEKALTGLHDVLICSDCVEQAYALLNMSNEFAADVNEAIEVSHGKNKDTKPKKLPTRQRSKLLLMNMLSVRMLRKTLAVAVYNHYKRIWYGAKSDVEIQKVMYCS